MGMDFALSSPEAKMRLFRDEDGQGMTEYGLLLGLISAVVMVAVFALAGSVNKVHQNCSDAVVNALGS